MTLVCSYFRDINNMWYSSFRYGIWGGFYTQKISESSRACDAFHFFPVAAVALRTGSHIHLGGAAQPSPVPLDTASSRPREGSMS